MSEPGTQRRYQRVNVDDNHFVRFFALERNFAGLPMTNLSAGGCCVRIPSTEAAPLEKETAVTRLRLIHPDLPDVPLQGRVCWILGKQPGKQDGFTLVGVEFVNPSPNFMKLLDEYVTGLLTEHG